MMMREKGSTARALPVALMACVLTVMLAFGLGATAAVASSISFGAQKAYAATGLTGGTIANAKLSKTKATVVKGKATTLTVSGAYGKAVTWKSLNPKVAKVTKTGSAKAKVTGVAVGKAYVQATVAGKSMKCSVSVVGKLNSTKLTVTPLQTKQLTLKGAKAKKWSSSDTTYAKVTKAGKVIPQKSGGSATITCTDTKGNKYKCTVKVVFPKITCEMLGTYSETPKYTTYYSKKFLFRNSTAKKIVLDNPTMMYFPYARDSDTSEVMLGQKDSLTMLDSNPVVLKPKSSAYFYGFEGTSYYTAYTDGIVGVYITCGGQEYTCLFQGTGKLVLFSRYNG